MLKAAHTLYVHGKIVPKTVKTCQFMGNTLQAQRPLAWRSENQVEFDFKHCASKTLSK